MINIESTEWRYQNFDRNRYRDLFSDTKFSETDTETFFPIPNFPKPKPIPSKNWQESRNREVSKPKCQSLRGRGGPWLAKLVPVNTKQQQIHFHHCQIMTTIFIGEYQITLWSMFLTCHFPFKGSLLNDPKIWFECCLALLQSMRISCEIHPWEIPIVHQSSSGMVGQFRWVFILLCYSVDAASMWTNLKSTPQVAGIYRDSQKAICASNFMNLLTNVILLFQNECWLEKRKPPCK